VPTAKARSTGAAPAARPTVAIPGRFSASASALRFEALAVARRLAAAVLCAGGEPVVVLPEVDADIGSKLRWADAVLLPGGGDLDPSFYGEEPATDTIYDVDRAQDAFDLAVARWAVEEGVALLAICRGTQVVNVACGGTLHQDIGSSHRARTEVAIEAGSRLAGLLGEGPFVVSCHHHQSVAKLGQGLVVEARAGDGTIEALDLPGATGFFAAVQWHPEDTYGEDPTQQALFRAFIESARA
jgi:putative glutamine amidotransferase